MDFKIGSWRQEPKHQNGGHEPKREVMDFTSVRADTNQNGNNKTIAHSLIRGNKTTTTFVS